ncbi:AAA family ATPase, partial [Blautia glucerasea]|uniref:AAA family ATPase n=1 Tax=Blautia glucerasea TaxID=536633 RepID=UPI001570E467
VQPEKIEIDANERAVNEKSQYCFFVCTTFDSFLNDLEKYSHEYLTLYAKEKADDIWIHENEWFLEWIQDTIPMIREIELDEVTIQTSQIQESLNTVFKGQYRRIGTNTSEMEFIDDTNRGVKFSLKDNNCLLDMPLRVTSRIFFIESPKLYDYLSNNVYGTVQKEYLRYLMSPNIFKSNKNISSNRLKEESEIQESSQRDSEITKRIEKVMGGRAEFLQKVGLEFKDNGLPESIHDINVSTGLKSLALLEYALRIGAIEKGDILILDEPEINLHPEWQVEYAKTLVDLQKEFGLKIVITSHSPYFMRAIECFTNLSDTMNLLNVYRVTRENKGESKIENVSYSEYGITELYEDLSAPLEKLDELLEKKYGGD